MPFGVREPSLDAGDDADGGGDDDDGTLFLYCMRCTKYRSEGEFFQYNIKHATRYCNRKECDNCRVPQLQVRPITHLLPS